MITIHLYLNWQRRLDLKVLTKTDESYICIDMGPAKALDMFRFFHPLSLDAISETLIDRECDIKQIQVRETQRIIPI